MYGLDDVTPYQMSLFGLYHCLNNDFMCTNQLLIDTLNCTRTCSQTDDCFSDLCTEQGIACFDDDDCAAVVSQWLQYEYHCGSGKLFIYSPNFEACECEYTITTAILSQVWLKNYYISEPYCIILLTANIVWCYLS